MKPLPTAGLGAAEPRGVRSCASTHRGSVDATSAISARRRTARVETRQLIIEVPADNRCEYGVDRTVFGWHRPDNRLYVHGTSSARCDLGITETIENAQLADRAALFEEFCERYRQLANESRFL